LQKGGRTLKREDYLEISIDYLRGKSSFNDLCKKLEEEVVLNVEPINLSEDKRVMLISNHPNVSREMDIPAEKIAGCKGGNTFNFPTFWFPILRQLMLKKIMKRRFFTIAHDIGWADSMQELSHLLVSAEEGGRTQEIIFKMEKDDSSIVIFPEGGVRDLKIFRTGFFHIACSLKIEYLIVGVFCPTKLSLNGENSFRIIDVIDMSELINSVSIFVNYQQVKIKNALI